MKDKKKILYYHHEKTFEIFEVSYDPNGSLEETNTFLREILPPFCNRNQANPTQKGKPDITGQD